MSVASTEPPNWNDDDELVIEDEVLPVPTRPLPALWENCNKVYFAMKKNAVKKTEGLIWEGSLTHLLTEVAGLGNAQYTNVTRRLQSMGCMRQLRRGGGPQPSVWLLTADPSPDAFFNADDTKVATRQQGRSKDDLQQQIRDLSRRLHNIEQYLRSHHGAPL